MTVEDERGEETKFGSSRNGKRSNLSTKVLFVHLGQLLCCYAQSMA